MKINKISLAIIAAAAVLAVCPAVHAQTDTNKPAARARGGMTVESQMDRIDKAVTLTETEKPKVKAAVEKMISAMQEARTADAADRRTKMSTARDEFNTEMKEILTPEQYTKFEAMPRGGRRGGAANGGAANGGAPGQ